MTRTRALAVGVVAVVVAVTVAACGDDEASPSRSSAPNSAAPLTVRSDAFFDGSAVPVRHTCDGDDISPPLTWEGAPAATVSFEVSVDDPDAPGGSFTHWDVQGIPANVSGLGEGVEPPGVVRQAWRGPCPPEGDGPHRYLFTVTAVDAAGEPLAEGVLLGTYERGGG